jgi:hypothetical protein
MFPPFDYYPGAGADWDTLMVKKENSKNVAKSSVPKKDDEKNVRCAEW